MAAEAPSTGPAAGVSPAVRDAELIARILLGERELFHELVRPYEKSLYFATFSILQNEQDAEDAAQETVLKALKNLRNFRAEAKFSTWLISIAVNDARARLRHARVLKFESVDETPPDEDGGFTPSVISDWREVPLQALERKELRELLQLSLIHIYNPLLFDANCGARSFCIINRARSSRVFTTPSLTSSAVAASAMLNSSTSRSSNTSR